MVARGLVAVLVAALAGCGGGGSGGSEILGEVVRQDDASEEALANLADEYELEGAVPSAQAATWVGPETTPALDPATPPTFEWTDETARHGVTTGKFVWLRLTATGVEQPLDVASITSTTFTPSAAQWSRLAPGGMISARLVTAQLDDGRVVLGPFEPADSTRTYTVGD